MKSELFTSRLDEKIIFEMETQKPADTVRCLPVFSFSLFTLPFSLYCPGRLREGGVTR